MAFDERLADRIRTVLAETPGIVEKRMFGGIGFLLHGNIVVGVYKDSLMARVGPDATEEALRRPHARVFDITGRPMKGWVMVAPGGLAGAKLEQWIDRARVFVATLPKK